MAQPWQRVRLEGSGDNRWQGEEDDTRTRKPTAFRYLFVGIGSLEVYGRQHCKIAILGLLDWQNRLLVVREGCSYLLEPRTEEESMKACI